MSGFVGLHIGLSGIRAAQYGLDTTSNNVANANTKGYTRRRVELGENPPYDTPVGPMGSGSKVLAVARTRDGFLDVRFRSTAASFAEQDARAGLLQRTEAILGEPETGISVVLGDVWDAFEDLSLDPAEPAARRQVLTALDSLASRFNAIDTAWAQLEDDTTVHVRDAVADVNGMLERVAQLNAEIRIVNLRGPANELMDERDLLLDQLASKLGATVVPADDDMMTVRLGSTDLVDGITFTPVTMTEDPLAFTAGGQTVAPGGEIGGQVAFVVSDLAAQRASLDALADAIAATLNAQHAAGYRPDGANGGPLLAGSGAGGITVAVSQLGELAAAGNPSAASYDGLNAAEVAKLRDGAIDAQLREAVVGLGRAVADTTRAADGQAALHASATVARQSAHGVSIDEEMVALVQYQRALEAASRVMTTVDEALDVLINRTGIVGR